MSHNDCGYDEGCCNACCDCECHGPREPEPAIKGTWEGPLRREFEYLMRDTMRRLEGRYYAKDYSKLVPSWVSITKAVPTPDSEDDCE